MSLEGIVALCAVLTFIYTVGAGIISYWINSISKSQENLAKTQNELANDIKEIEVMLPNDYVKKADLDARLSRMESTLDLIFKKLDGKADKNHV